MSKTTKILALTISSLFLILLVFNRFIIFHSMVRLEKLHVIDQFYAPTYSYKYLNPLTLTYDLNALGTAGDYEIAYLKDHNTIVIGEAVIDGINGKSVDVIKCSAIDPDTICFITIDGGKLAVDQWEASYVNLSE